MIGEKGLTDMAHHSAVTGHNSLFVGLCVCVLDHNFGGDHWFYLYPGADPDGVL